MIQSHPKTALNGTFYSRWLHNTIEWKPGNVVSGYFREKV